MIPSQQNVIKLQEGLLKSNNEQLTSIQTSAQNTVQQEMLTAKNEQVQFIQSAVHSTVQSEIRSYSAADSTPPTSAPKICEKSLKTAVRDVIKKGDRSRNLVIHGLIEEAGERLSEKVLAVFESLGEKPSIEAYRMGKSLDGQSKRPVKGVFSNITSARRKDKNLSRHVRNREICHLPRKIAKFAEFREKPRNF